MVPLVVTRLSASVTKAHCHIHRGCRCGVDKYIGRPAKELQPLLYVLVRSESSSFLYILISFDERTGFGEDLLGDEENETATRQPPASTSWWEEQGHFSTLPFWKHYGDPAAVNGDYDSWGRLSPESMLWSIARHKPADSLELLLPQTC